MNINEVEHRHKIDGGELLIGCGNDRKKHIYIAGEGGPDWTKLTTLDANPDCNPDYVWDLNHLPYPFEDECFDEIHAYEVLEHCGTQGDYRFFFAQFEEFHRILKPGGLFVATVPMWDNIWAWGDPGHTRVINAGSLVFLSQSMYAKGVGNTPMTDYRHCYKADFEILNHNGDDEADRFAFVLRKK